MRARSSRRGPFWSARARRAVALTEEVPEALRGAPVTEQLLSLNGDAYGRLATLLRESHSWSFFHIMESVEFITGVREFSLD